MLFGICKKNHLSSQRLPSIAEEQKVENATDSIFSSEKAILKKCLKGIRKETANVYNKYTVRRQNLNP